MPKFPFSSHPFRPEKPISTDAPTVVEADITPDSVAPNSEEAAPTSAKKRVPIGRPEWWLAGGFAIGVGALAWFARPAPAPITPENTPLATSPAPTIPLVPVSDTLLIAAGRAPAYATLRGRLRAAGIVTGQAPISGQVSRVWVKVGQKVSVSDRVLSLSGGAMSRAPRRVEQQQNSAEAAQVQAVQGKQQIERKISAARGEYREAVLRVEAADRRLSEARGLLTRLRSGETIPMPGARTKTTVRPTPTKTRRENTGTTKRDDSARKAALARAIDAQKVSERAASDAKTAFYAATAAQNSARLKKSRLETAQASLQKTEAQFAEKTATAADVDKARGETEAAQADSTDAIAKAKTARETADRLDRAAAAARESAQKTATQITQSLQKLNLGDDAASKTPTPTSDNDNSDNGKAAAPVLTLRAAAEMVRSAIADSEKATRNAQKWKSEVDNYGKVVASTSSRIEASSKDLASAQQKVLDSTLEKNLSIVRAPADGTVLSVAEVAQNVDPGAALVQIQRGGGFEVIFEDRSGAWRHLKEGMRIPARLESEASPKPTATRSAIMRSVMLRVREIEVPDAARTAAPDPKKPVIAQLSASVAPVGQNAAPLRAGTAVICSIATANVRDLVSVPSSAVWRDGTNQAMIAVLEPVTAVPETTSPAPNATPATTAASNAPTATDTPTPEAPPAPAGSFHLQWRPVTLDALPANAIPANATQTTRRVLSGLLPGERILRQAASWQRWSQVHGADALVHVALS